MKKNIFVALVCVIVLSLFATGCSDDSASGDQDTGSSSGDMGVAPDFGFGDTSSSSSSGADAGCAPGQQVCVDSATLSVCVSGALVQESCEDGNVCRNNACLPPETLCETVGEAYACESTVSERICGADQQSYTVNACGPGEMCAPEVGQCESGGGICGPGTFKCGNNTPQQCSADGTEWVSVSGPGGEKESCSVSEGRCVSLCEADTKDASFLGCEYFIVDMDNDERDYGFGSCTDDSQCLPGESCNGSCTLAGEDDRPFGITISNPKTIAADVTVLGAGQTINVTVGPGQLEVLELNAYTDVNTNGVHSGAVFFLQSDVPVTVHQFNPLNGTNIYSNDASLLLPTTSVGTEYIVLNYSAVPGDATTTPETDTGSSYIDVVAVENATTVTVRSLTGAVVPGLPLPQTHTLQQGQLLHLLASGTTTTEITGVKVEADKPVSVLTGIRCATIPNGTDWCDHIEQQLFPLSTWGTEYFAAKFSPRGTEDDVWRILAAEDGTTVTLSPAQAGQSTIALNAGEFHEVRSSANFKISANQPISVGQFMVGSTYAGIPDHADCIGAIGDPAFTLSVPTAQYRSDYIVLTPPGYNENFLNIIAPQGTVPRLDGVAVDTLGSLVRIEGMEIYRLPVSEGPHFLQGTGVFGVMAYGYACDVSYAYPGGLDLEALN